MSLRQRMSLVLMIVSIGVVAGEVIFEAGLLFFAWLFFFAFILGAIMFILPDRGDK